MVQFLLTMVIVAAAASSLRTCSASYLLALASVLCVVVYFTFQYVLLSSVTV